MRRSGEGQAQRPARACHAASSDDRLPATLAALPSDPLLGSADGAGACSAIGELCWRAQPLAQTQGSPGTRLRTTRTRRVEQQGHRAIID